MPLPSGDVLRIPLLKPCSEDAHKRGEDRVDRANKAGGIRLHDEICPDGRDQVEDSPCGGEDAIRPHKDRVSQRCISVVAVFGVMGGQRHVCETDELSGNNWSKVPTTLIELGFMSNPSEDRKMQTSTYQKKMVKGMANGIKAYFLGK